MLEPKKITNAAPGWTGNEYASINSFNCDNTKLLLISSTGTFWLYDFLTNSGAETYLLASEEPRWDKHDSNKLYFISFSSRSMLCSYDAGKSASRIVRNFTEYVTIKGMGESDISEDGDHFVLCGILSDGTSEVFTYCVSKDLKSKAFKLAAPIDGLKISPSNLIVMSSARGIEVLDPNTYTTRLICKANGHAAVGRDTDGTEILVWTNSNDPSPIDACQNGIVKVRLSDGKQTCLQQLDWSLAVDISLQACVVLVSTYAPTDKGAPFTNQVLKVALDGSGAEVLCDHGSKPLSAYNWQPKAALSRDGSRFVFSSNMGIAIPEYIDTYYCKLTDAKPQSVAAIPAPSSESSIWTSFIEKDQFGNLRGTP